MEVPPCMLRALCTIGVCVKTNQNCGIDVSYDWLSQVKTIIRCETFRYMNSFFPDTIISWNKVITHFNNVLSFGNMKEHIRSLIRPEKKSIFGIHDPSGVRYLFQLRVG